MREKPVLINSPHTIYVAANIIKGLNSQLEADASIRIISVGSDVILRRTNRALAPAYSPLTRHISESILN